MKHALLLMICLSSFISAQVNVASIQKLPIPQNERWGYPVFSKSGNEIFFTNLEFNGIWQYSLSTKLLKEVTKDKGSGYNFSISDDGSKIAYRRTLVEGDHFSRIQEVVELDLKTVTETVSQRGNSVSTPVFINNSIVTAEKFLHIKQISTKGINLPQVLGIEETKIALLLNGNKILFDPLQKGQYIWPQLSPDKSQIVAVEMDRGAFISDLTGQLIVRLGKCNAPQWLRSGKWIIGMDDKDDGHEIFVSDIIAVSVDGKTKLNLTQSFEEIAMFPACSPIDNRIIFNTAAGKIFLLTYEEVR